MMFRLEQLRLDRKQSEPVFIDDDVLGLED